MGRTTRYPAYILCLVVVAHTFDVAVGGGVSLGFIWTMNEKKCIKQHLVLPLVGEKNVEECQLSAVGLFRTDVEEQPMVKKCAYSSEVEPNCREQRGCRRMYILGFLS